MSFVLVKVGDRPLQSRDEARSACSQIPFSSLYVLGDGQWRSMDTVFTGCGKPEHGPEPSAVTGTGRFVMRGDTIDFFVPDSAIGQRGLVGRGILRGDSLLLWESDLDGGDYLYLRRESVRP